MSDECLFCKIAAGDIPSTQVYSDDDFVAFRDINPAANTHILIIPRKHIETIAHAESEDAALLGMMMLRANQIARDEGLADDGYRYVINCGVHGGQTVYHLHLHILGGRPLSWPPG